MQNRTLQQTLKQQERTLQYQEQAHQREKENQIDSAAHQARCPAGSTGNSVELPGTVETKTEVGTRLSTRCHQNRNQTQRWKCQRKPGRSILHPQTLKDRHRKQKQNQ